MPSSTPASWWRPESGGEGAGGAATGLARAGRLYRWLMRSPARLLVAVALLILPACGGDGSTTSTPVPVTTPGLPVTYTGADGVTTTVTDVSRIVSLSGDFSEILWDLGLGDNIVGVDLSSVYPKEEMRVKPKVGVEYRILTEPILTLEPTLVIGDVDAQPDTVIDQVRAAGVPVVIFPRFMGTTAPAEKIRAVANLLGLGDAGERMAERVQSEVDAAIRTAAGAQSHPRVAVVYIATKNTILLLGSNTVFDGLLEAVGATDVGPPAGADGFVPLTPEALIAASPDVIITAQRGFDGAGGMDGFLATPGVAQTPAGQSRSVLVYEDLLLLGLGPRTGQLLDQLVVDLHPELG
jgi:iron complex transport system substrate-binding protein